MDWEWVYKIAVDIPQSPGPKTVRTYYEFFKSLMTVIPDKEERLAYRKLAKDGPFKLTSTTLAGGPEKTLQWAVDIRNGILLSLGKAPKDDAQKLWGLLKYSRSTRNKSDNNINDENLDIHTVKSVKEMEEFAENGRLSVVMFDRPHLIIIPRARDKEAAMDLAQFKARFAIDAAIVPGNLSYKWYFAKPFSAHWKYRVTKFPWFRIYKNGKILAESKDPADIKRYLKQRAMRNAPIQYTSFNNNRVRVSPSAKGVVRSFANGFSQGAGQVTGQYATRAAFPRLMPLLP